MCILREYDRSVLTRKYERIALPRGGEMSYEKGWDRALTREDEMFLYKM